MRRAAADFAAFAGMASEFGTWAFHGYIPTRVESDEGMFGIVTALVGVPEERRGEAP